MSVVLLLDVSSSMNLPAARGQRRIDVLQAALRHVLPDSPGTRVVAFNDIVTEIEPRATVPEPEGRTALHLALLHAMRWQPAKVIIVSDGEPDDKQAAIAAARALGCVIETIHCGPEDDRAAIGFLKTLALCSRGGLGRALRSDLSNPEALKGDLRRLLITGPAK